MESITSSTDDLLDLPKPPSTVPPEGSTGLLTPAAALGPRFRPGSRVWCGVGPVPEEGTVGMVISPAGGPGGQAVYKVNDADLGCSMRVQQQQHITPNLLQARPVAQNCHDGTTAACGWLDLNELPQHCTDIHARAHASLPVSRCCLGVVMVAAYPLLWHVCMPQLLSNTCSRCHKLPLTCPASCCCCCCWRVVPRLRFVITWRS